jgi:MFS family permease
VIGAPGCFYYGWAIVAALGIVTIIAYGTTQYLFGLLVVPVSHDLGWSRAEVSGAISISFLVSGVLGLPTGRLVDRFGARGLMAAGSVLAAPSLVGLSFVQRLYEFYLLWGVGVGLAMALTLYPVSLVVVANWFHRRRGSAMALLTFLGGLSSAIYIPLSALLIRAVGWRHALMALSLTQLLVALPAELLFVRRRPEDHGLLPDGGRTLTLTTHPSHGSTLREALVAPAFWTLTVAHSLSFLGSTALTTHLVAYLINRGSAPVTAATIAAFLGVASLPGRITLNVLSDRVAAKNLLGLANSIQATGVGLLALASSPFAMVVSIGLYGLGYGSGNSLRATMMADYFGRRAYGAINSVQNLAGVLGAASGPLLVGSIFDRMHSYLLGLGLIGGGHLAAAMMILGTRRSAVASLGTQAAGIATSTAWGGELR